ncbi:MAG: hypothetical protein K2N26_01885 [Oscillospiraceae bacterium]|nr:hypothetical protein [Oscillospiraceae bacterium]MDE7278459.1 hypothetical protein [Oscillospiraceae bacterium]
MDCNEFSFEALFKNDEFQIYESNELVSAFKELNRVLESYIKDSEVRLLIERAALDCSSIAQESSFKQGFCFAVKSIKFLMKI